MDDRFSKPSTKIAILNQQQASDRRSAVPSAASTSENGACVFENSFFSATPLDIEVKNTKNEQVNLPHIFTSFEIQ